MKAKILFVAKNIFLFRSTLNALLLFVMEVNAAQRSLTQHKY